MDDHVLAKTKEQLAHELHLLSRKITELESLNHGGTNEQTLHGEQEFVSVVLDTVDALVLVLDEEGRIVRFNKTCERITGYAFAEVKGRHVWDFLLMPEEVEPVKAVFANLRRGMFPNRYENHWVTKDGRGLFISWSNTALLGSHGDIKYIVPTGIEITEQRKAEHALKLSEEKFRKLSQEFQGILDAIPDKLTLQSPDLEIIWANRGASNGSGKDVSELLGQYCYTLWHTGSEPCAPCPVQRSFKTGNMENEIISSPDGKIWDLRTVPVKDEGGNITSVVELGRDITEHRRLEEQLRQAQKMEAIGQLAGGVAHDFNNILTAIMGYCNLMQLQTDDGNPLRPHIDQVLAAAEKAATLTKSLLAFSKKQIINPAPLSLNSIIRKMEGLIRRLIGEDIEIRTILSDTDPTIKTGSGQIEQVLMNLAANARDAMPEGGLLTIETRYATVEEIVDEISGDELCDRYVLLSVTDTGSGIHNTVKDKIFDPFFTTKGMGKGTGLGLATVYGIIEQHNGYIRVCSEPGNGTTFKIYLPVVSAPVPQAMRIPSPSLEGGTETILIAEDNHSVRALSRDILEKFGYTIITANDGKDALEKFKKDADSIHLLLLDVMMPIKNGKDVYEEARKVRPDIKALFLSGYTANVIHDKGILQDGLNFLMKPVTIADLLQKIREVLDQ